MEIIDQLQAAIKTAIKESPLSVEQIAEEMSRLLGRGITPAQIYSWTKVSDRKNGRTERHVPAEFLPAFCRAVNSSEPILVLCRSTVPAALRIEAVRLEGEIAKAEALRDQHLRFLEVVEKGAS